MPRRNIITYRVSGCSRLRRERTDAAGLSGKQRMVKTVQINATPFPMLPTYDVRTSQSQNNQSRIEVPIPIARAGLQTRRT
jgi:hypothetical protein